jgi:hypothetical protein
MKIILKKTPEIVLIISVILYWYDTSLLFNPIAIVLLSFLLLTLITGNKILKYITSFILGMISIYLAFAVISEYREFGNDDFEEIELLFIGLAIFLTSLTLSILMAISNPTREI